jgi:hypothetical protein
MLVASLLLLLLSHPLVHGDGIAYFMWLDSIAGDGDFDLSNQTIVFAPAIAYPLANSPITGTPVTPFPFGSAFLLAPFFWLARALLPLVPALRAHPEHFLPVQGLPLAYSLAVALGAHVYALAAVGLAYLAALRLAPGWAAALAAVGVLVGTPLLYYATVESMDAHVYGAAALALAYWLATRRRQTNPFSRNLAITLALGLALGLAVLVRWQLLLYALPLGVAFALPIHEGARTDTKDVPSIVGASSWMPSPSSRQERVRSIGVFVAFAAGLGLYCALCGLYFWRFFGSPLVIPNDAITGQPFVGAPLRFLPEVLLAPYNGWLSWSPIAALGMAGLAGIALREQGPWRALGVTGMAGIALQLALNSSLHDWFGGWAFGQRRMAEAYPLLVVGCAWLLGRARWRKTFAMLTVVCALYGGFLLIAHLYYTHTSEHPEGGTVVDVAGWLLSAPHGPTPAAIWGDRYGPWAWARPEQ